MTSSQSSSIRMTGLLPAVDGSALPVGSTMGSHSHASPAIAIRAQRLAAWLFDAKASWRTFITEMPDSARKKRRQRRHHGQRAAKLRRCDRARNRLILVIMIGPLLLSE